MSDEENPHIDQIIRLKTAAQQFIDGELGVGDFEDIIKEPIAGWYERAEGPAILALREAREEFFHWLHDGELNNEVVIGLVSRIDALLSGKPEWPEEVTVLVKAARVIADPNELPGQEEWEALAAAL